MRRLKICLLWVCRRLGLFLAARWLTRRQLRILCYHGFAFGDEASFRPKLFISPQRFEERLAALRRYRMRVIPLDEAVDRLYSGTLPNFAVAITVDDGFHSFYSLAVPRLAHYRFPATVYVTTYYVRKGCPIFRLVVQYMFWKTRKQTLTLNAHAWGQNGPIDLKNSTEMERAMWTFIEFGERNCTEVERQQMCRDLGELLEVPFEPIVASRSLHLMSESELRSLGSSDVSVGLHTHRHSFPGHDRAQAEREILENWRELSQLAGNVVPHFCYPSGVWREHEWGWLDSLRIKSSTTCIPGLNGLKTPRQALRRYLDGEDVHLLEFEAAICGFLTLLHGMKSLLSYRKNHGHSQRVN